MTSSCSLPQPPNPVSLEMKVGEEFEIKSIKLPLAGETSLLRPKISFPENLELLGSEKNQNDEWGFFSPISYKFKAIKEGRLEIHIYFSKYNSEEQWIPQENSPFKKRIYEQRINVTIV